MTDASGSSSYTYDPFSEARIDNERAARLSRTLRYRRQPALDHLPPWIGRYLGEFTDGRPRLRRSRNLTSVSDFNGTRLRSPIPPMAFVLDDSRGLAQPSVSPTTRPTSRVPLTSRIHPTSEADTERALGGSQEHRELPPACGRLVNGPCFSSVVTPPGRLSLSGRAPDPTAMEGRSQFEERTLQRRRPRPGLVQAQHEPPAMAHEHRRDVQDPVAERLRLGFLSARSKQVICARRAASRR